MQPGTKHLVRNLLLVASAFVTLSSFAAGYPGRLDHSFGLNVAQGNLGETMQVNAVEVQPDGKVILAGNFRLVNETRRDIIRLNADNTIDTTFNAGTGLAGNGGAILAVKLQPDGKILIGGTFNNFNGSFVPRLIRLNADGTVDPAFNASGPAESLVFDIDLQSSGKVLISVVNPIGSSFVARFAATGAHDNTFVHGFFPGSGFRIDVTAGDKIFMAGVFNYMIGPNQGSNLARLGPDGALDTTFLADVAATTFPVMDLKEIEGGRVLIWGRFDFVNNLARRGVAIVNGDGSTDLQFDPEVVQVETIRAAEYQSGKVIIAGENFIRTNTRLRGNIARLNADGSIDTTFFQGRGALGVVRVVRLRSANRLVIGGDFLRYDRVPRRTAAQIHV